MGAAHGTGYNRNVSQWSRGEYHSANNTQDDLAVIGAKTGYRSDDHGNTSGAATLLTITGGTNISATTLENDPANINRANKGVLELNNDVDVFSFTTGSGLVSLTVNPWAVPAGRTRGGNLDVLLELRNDVGALLLTSNPLSQTLATIQTSLAAGRYYLHVRNTGAGSPLSSPPSGYTSYGSIGQYFISGYIAPTGGGEILSAITVTASDATAGEPGSGQGTGTFVFSRTGSTAAALTVNYTVGGTAGSGTDYTAPGTSVSFPAGLATTTRTVSVIDDSILEGDETVIMTVASGSGYTVSSPGSATVTLRDDDASCTPTALVTGTTLGTARKNYNGWVGMRFQVGSNPLEVQSLGRVFLSGNFRSHELRLVTAAIGSTVASVIWTATGGVHNQIKYAALAAPVTLAPNTAYYLASRETKNGDQWYSSDTVVTTTSAATVLSSVSSNDGSTWSSSNTAGHTYGPVSFTYCAAGAPSLAAGPRVTNLTVLNGGQVRLTVSGLNGQRCEIQASENLTDWTTIGEAVPNGDGSLEFTDVGSANRPMRFYRAMQPASAVEAVSDR